MNNSTTALDHAKRMRIIHFALFASVFMIGVALPVFFSRTGDPPPTLVLGRQPPAIGFGLAGAGALAIAVAFAVLRQRIPARGSDESPESYWNTERVNAAVLLWVVIEAAGVIGVVGYIVTGLWTPLALGPIAVLAGFFVRPSVLENS